MRRSAVRKLIVAALLVIAAAAAFIVSPRLGQRWLRSEAELELSSLLGADTHIEQIELGFGFGLSVHAANVRVDNPSTGTPSLVANQVTATFKTTSLLTGRLRIAALTIEGLEIEASRGPAGRWSPGFLFGETASEPAPADPTRSLQRAIAAAHFLLRDQEVADRIQVRGGEVRFSDSLPADGAHSPTRLRVEALDGTLDRSWLLGKSQLELTATAAGPHDPPAVLELAGEWSGDEADLHLALAFTGLDLTILQPYLLTPDSNSRIAGRASGVVAIVTPGRERGRLELDWSFDALDGHLRLGETELHFSDPLRSFKAQLTLEPDRLVAESVHLQGKSVALDVRGSISRPVGPDSIGTLRAELSRTGLADLRQLAGALPRTEAAPFLAVLDRIQSGQIPRVGLRGGATWQQWQKLLSGTTIRLPETLQLSADIEDVTFGTSPTDTIRDVSSHLTFSGETLEIHGLTGLYNDEPMPRVDLAIGGISRLLEGALASEQITRRSRPLPGLGALWDVVRGDAEPSTEPAPSPIHLRLDELQHPALRYPLRNADILIDPTERDLHVAIRRGTWAGQPILGEAILDRDPIPELRIELVVDEAAIAESEPLQPAPTLSDNPTPPPQGTATRLRVAPDADPQLEPATAQDGEVWASGRISTGAIEAGPLGFIQIEGDFVLRGQTLSVSGIKGDLERQGSLQGTAHFDLGNRDEVPARIAFTAHEAESNVIAELFGLESGLVTGSTNVQGHLEGPLRPGTGVIDHAIGQISIDAYAGEIRQRIPLLSRIAHAIEGWNPATAGKALQYERIESRIDFERGNISTDRFALEGPLRVVASGSIDFNQDPAPIEATLGLFLIRQTNQIFGEIPLVNLLVPGSDEGLIGAYFQVTGAVRHPIIRAMPVTTIAKGMPLPPVLRAPLDTLLELLAGGKKPKDRQPEPQEESAP